MEFQTHSKELSRVFRQEGKSKGKRIYIRRMSIMLYPFMTLNDQTEIVHSEILERNGTEAVKVCIEKPIEGGFHSAVCYLPNYS